LTPDQAARLVAAGHCVWVERTAGADAGYADEQYARAGAQMAAPEQVYENATLIVKVKCPLRDEYPLLSDRHLLFCFLHFDENLPPGDIRQIVATGVTALAFEWVERAGRFPLLQPMSELTGAIIARKTMTLLLENQGVLGGKYLSHWKPATALVLGVGHIGANAVNVFLRNRYRLVIVDKHPEQLKERLAPYVSAATLAQGDVTVVPFDELDPGGSTQRVRRYLPETDIVVCAAVRRATLPKERCEYLLTRRDVQTLKPFSVVSDATACNRDFIETCIATEGLNETYREEDIVHYNCDHVPAVAARTATDLLSEAVFPYVVALCTYGLEEAIDRDPDLKKGVMCYRKHITHEYTARKKNLEWAAWNENRLDPSLRR
jgi:alanine dehydrogenase